MKYRKENKLVFKDRVETIVKASNDSINGVIKTDVNKYSTDFVNRWVQFGFVKIE